MMEIEYGIVWKLSIASENAFSMRQSSYLGRWNAFTFELTSHFLCFIFCRFLCWLILVLVGAIGDGAPIAEMVRKWWWWWWWWWWWCGNAGRKYCSWTSPSWQNLMTKPHVPLRYNCAPDLSSSGEQTTQLHRSRSRAHVVVQSSWRIIGPGSGRIHHGRIRTNPCFVVTPCSQIFSYLTTGPFR